MLNNQRVHHQRSPFWVSQFWSTPIQAIYGIYGHRLRNWWNRSSLPALVIAWDWALRSPEALPWRFMFQHVSMDKFFHLSQSSTWKWSASHRAVSFNTFINSLYRLVWGQMGTRFPANFPNQIGQSVNPSLLSQNLQHQNPMVQQLSISVFNWSVGSLPLFQTKRKP